MKRILKSEAMQAAKRLIHTEDGKTVIGYLLAKHGFSNRTTFDENPGRWGINEGKRLILVELGTLIDGDVAKQEQLEREAKQ